MGIDVVFGNKYCQKPMKKVLFRGIVILLVLYYIGWAYAMQEI